MIEEKERKKEKVTEDKDVHTAILFSINWTESVGKSYFFPSLNH